MVDRCAQQPFDWFAENFCSNVPLDTLVERGKVPGKIRLAEIDVEGFELEVLRGCTASWRMHVRF
jgi:FkbM family methyltransferase